MTVNSVIISRTDNIGDVVLTLPMAGLLKKAFPGIKVYFIGKSYTEPVISASAFVDQFIDREQALNNASLLKELKADAIVFVYPDKALAAAAKKAGIRQRIGTSHRIFHWLYCNKLINFSRKKSPLHEAELNQVLLKPFKVPMVAKEELAGLYGFTNIIPLKEELSFLIEKGKFNLILHPKSKGSAREWPLINYLELIKRLPEQEYNIIITGTEAEGNIVKQEMQSIFQLPNVKDATGKCSLKDLIALINNANGLVACSTGPLHIASALGKNACGIYPPIKPMHPGRWSPLGKKATYLVLDKNCEDCRESGKCACIASIDVHQLETTVKKWREQNQG